jgi:hypothetical protein
VRKYVCNKHNLGVGGRIISKHIFREIEGPGCGLDSSIKGGRFLDKLSYLYF